MSEVIVRTLHPIAHDEGEPIFEVNVDSSRGSVTKHDIGVVIRGVRERGKPPQEMFFPWSNVLWIVTEGEEPF